MVFIMTYISADSNAFIPSGYAVMVLTKSMTTADVNGVFNGADLI